MAGPMRTSSTTRLALPALAAVTLVVTGCGAESGRVERVATVVTVVAGQTVPLPAATARVTDPARARYVAKVDAICRVRNPERDAAVKAAGEAGSEEEAVKAYDRSITTADDQLREIEAVTPPSADRELITTNVVDRLRRRLALRRLISQDLARSDATSASRHRAELDALTISLQSFARGYGFHDCGAK